METIVQDIQQNFEEVRQRITQAARRAGRDPEAVKLVVVTKGQPLEIVRKVIESGAVRLGENYPEEAATKMKALQAISGIEWHMTGSIQSRKAGFVAENFGYIHSLGRLKEAAKLNRRAVELGKQIPALVQINVSGELSKSGLPARDESDLSQLLEFISGLARFESLEIRGLMTIPPYDADPENARPYFQRARKIRDILASKYPSSSWEELSMGMSGDFEVAIEEGATFVRIGTAIVGSRTKITL